MALNYFQIVEQIASSLRTPEIHFAYSGLARTYADLGDVEQGHRHITERELRVLSLFRVNKVPKRSRWEFLPVPYIHIVVSCDCCWIFMSVRTG